MAPLRSPFIGDYCEPDVTLALVPFALDPPTSLSLAADALRVRLAPGEDLRDLLPPVESAIRSAHARGGLARSDGATKGIVVWEPAGPLGVAVRVLYLEASIADPDGYRELLDLAHRAAGPIAFAPGPLAGLSADEERTMMTERGFAAFGRSEMGVPTGASIVRAPRPAGGSIRAVRPEDELPLARLHELAYRNHLDRFLSLEDLDPGRDADHQLRDFFAGRWGPPQLAGSAVVELEGKLVAAALAVRRTAHSLILDVMTDPTLQGRGLARAALSNALLALRSEGERAIVLNVTEGNERAIRLYSHVGFVRTVGPSQEWYDARRIRVEIPPAPAGQPVAGA